ncbi:MAG: thioredoxin domain-containing protein [Christensenellales bacterium]
MAEQNAGRKKLALKILLPVVIVLVIAGIWLIKANEKNSDKEQPIASSTVSAENTEPKATANPDFVLAASKIDLEQLKSYGLPIIIDFGADSCIPCKEMAPVLKKLNKEWQGKVIVKFVDVWKYTDAAADFPLQVIPTQFFFDAKGNPYVPSDPEGMGMQMYALQETDEHILTAHQGGLTEDQIREIFKEMGVD